MPYGIINSQYEMEIQRKKHEFPNKIGQNCRKIWIYPKLKIKRKFNWTVGVFCHPDEEGKINWSISAI